MKDDAATTETGMMAGADIPDDVRLAEFSTYRNQPLRRGAAGPAGTVWVRCPKCGEEVCKATFTNNGRPILLDTVTVATQYTADIFCSAGNAMFVPNHGNMRKHRCLGPVA